MSNLGPHTDNNFEYGDQFGRIAGTVQNGTKHLAAITSIMNPNDLSKAAPAINAAVNQALRFHNVEQNMSGTDTGQHTALENVTTAINAIKPALALYPNARWAYFRNEIGDWTRADFYALEMKLWIEELAKLGYYGGICCWSFGTPSYELWPKFDTALAAANANGGAVLLHEYGVLTMKSEYNAGTGRGHHCLRYRNVWAQNNYPARFPKLMWWVTETGLDRDVNAGIGGGWKESGVTADQYLSDLYWYDSEISKDGVSATVYQWGTDPVWWAYDIQGPVVDNLLAHIGAGMPNLKAGGVITPPVDPPVDPPQPPTTRTLFSMQPLHYDPPADSRHYFPGDTYGDRWCPLDTNGNKLFFYGWNEPDDKISHVEPFPPVGTSFPAPVALRVQNQAPKINFWFGVTLDTVPGEVLTITLGSDAEIIDNDLGEVFRRITVDLAGGVKPTTQYSETGGQGYRLGTYTITATGPRTTVMAQTRCSVPARVNVDYDVFLVRANVTTTPPTPPTPKAPYDGITTGNLNARLGKSDNGQLVGVLPAGSTVKVLDDDGTRATIQVSVLRGYIKPK